MSDVNSVEMKKEIAEELIKSGVCKDEADNIASKQVDSMGVVRVKDGTCPLGMRNPMACMFCRVGHMTECHHPYTCEEANCSHYQSTQ